MTDYEIPEEWADKLEHVEVADTRSDEEILAALNQHVPVTSEKNIWAFWHDGLMKMPSWCQRNAIDWVRICGPSGWTIRVLDNDPESPNYALRHLSAGNLPECFVARTMDGPYVGQHSADFTRGAAILEHGGAWMDVGSIMIRHIETMCWNAICDPESPYKVATVWKDGQWIFNYFVAAQKGDPFIRRWHELFMHLWKGRTNADGITMNPLFMYIIVMMTKQQEEQKEKARKEQEEKARLEKEGVETSEQPAQQQNGQDEVVQQEETQPAAQQKGESAESQDQQKPSELQATGDLAFLDWKVGLRELMDYGSQIAAWHRVASLEDVGDGFSGVDYWTNNMLLLELFETCKPMLYLGFRGDGPARTLAMMSMQRQADDGAAGDEAAETTNEDKKRKTDESHGEEEKKRKVEEDANGEDSVPVNGDAQQDEAADQVKPRTPQDDRDETEKAVWETLATGSFCKISHSKGLTHSKQLGVLLDEQEQNSAGQDQAPGTFWDLLRYGTVHFRQKRASPVVRAAPRPTETLAKALLEA
ncbi:capsular polysaccharide synthesis protein [Sarocladium implicatum]|nr:capsular polysaccharide synthesis protein [Sarocladium implicatum]